MLKKWWVWLLIVLFIVINLIVTDLSPDQNNRNPIDTNISTH